MSYDLNSVDFMYVLKPTVNEDYLDIQRRKSLLHCGTMLLLVSKSTQVELIQMLYLT